MSAETVQTNRVYKINVRFFPIELKGEIPSVKFPDPKIKKIFYNVLCNEYDCIVQ